MLGGELVSEVFTYGERSMSSPPNTQAMLPKTPSREIQSVRTALEMINVVQNMGSVTPSELTNHLDLSKSSVHNYLATLEQMGYVVNEDGRYRLGLRFLTHGIAARNSLRIAHPVVDALQSAEEAVSAPVWWISEEYGRGIFLASSSQQTKSTSYGTVGKRSYLHTHALGKAILAHVDDRYKEEILAHHGLSQQTMRTTTDYDLLEEDLEAIRDRGFAVSDGEAVLGVLSVGASFTDQLGRYHAVGVFGDSRNLTGNRATEIGTELKNTAGMLTDTLQSEGN